jgi:hypothetical protein
MPEATPALDAATRAALQKLADIAVPDPVSWVPRTWGWAVLAIALLILAGWMALRAVRRYAANRYRREALHALDDLEKRLPNDAERGEALVAMAELLKRVSLSAWPRVQVAPLWGGAWVAFLRAHGKEGRLPEPVAQLLDDLEYRSARPAMSAEDGQAVAKAVRNWIEGHVVSA